MENKYSELERLNNLKMNGTISETEFEVQKYRILNTTTENTNTRNKSSIFFILTGISAIITIIWCIILYFWNDTLDTDLYFKYHNTSLNDSISRIVDTGLAVLVITTILMLILGVIFKIKEKGGIKIVD